MQPHRILYPPDDGVRKMIETYYRILKHDPDGKLVKDTGLMPSHSYVIQLLELFECFFDHKGKSATDVNGAETTILGGGGHLSMTGRVNAGVGNDTYGLVVGTNAGPTVEDNENYKLDTKITDGGGAGQLNYQATTFVNARVVGPNVDVDISRVFPNTSGGTVTVKEIGIICKNTLGIYYHLLLRDVVSDEAVLDGYSLTVVYTLRTTA